MVKKIDIIVGEVAFTKYRGAEKCRSSQIKQEGHSSPDLIYVHQSHKLMCPMEAQFVPHGHYLNKLGSGPLGDATNQIFKF